MALGREFSILIIEYMYIYLSLSISLANEFLGPTYFHNLICKLLFFYYSSTFTPPPLNNNL